MTMTRITLAAAIAAAAFVQAIHAQEAAPVTVRVDANGVIGEISPYIYGINNADWPGARHLTLRRSGGNRLTAYNWENNASNAGSDWHHQNDAYLGQSDVPGQTVREFVEPTLAQGQVALVTVPMAGYVSADKGPEGDVRNSGPDYLQTRFHESKPRKGAAFAYPPDANDDVVYQDEFVWWLENEFADEQRARPGADIWYSLDNEPDLWSHTHARIHSEPVTYAEMIDRTDAWAGAIKDVAPDALVFGFVSYGYGGYTNLQGAPDAGGRDFIDFFLAEARRMEQEHGRRLVDVLDLHWYPEARGRGEDGSTKRITFDREGANDPGVVRARLEAPRSLWDPTYKEESWIANDVIGGPIALLPRLREKIERHYPGTRLAFTEYNYGGTGHISGGLAQADVLGIFGREGVFAAALWPLGGDMSYVFAAFDAYRNHDGHGGRFGDIALKAESSDPDVSAYASKFADPADDRLVLVLINKTEAEQPIDLEIANFDAGETTVDRFGEGSSEVRQVQDARANDGALVLPPMTVSTVVVRGR